MKTAAQGLAWWVTTASTTILAWLIGRMTKPSLTSKQAVWDAIETIYENELRHSLNFPLESITHPRLGPDRARLGCANGKSNGFAALMIRVGDAWRKQGYKVTDAFLELRKFIESDRPFSSNPVSHFHGKRTPVFMRVDSLEAGQSAHAGVVSGV